MLLVQGPGLLEDFSLDVPHHEVVGDRSFPRLERNQQTRGVQHRFQVVAQVHFLDDLQKNLVRFD